MADPLNGDDLLVRVETATPATFVDVSDMDNVDDGSEQAENSFPVFGNKKYIVPGTRDVNITVSGFFNPTDAGQIRLLGAEKARTVIKVQILYDGTNGYTVPVRVKSRKGNGKPNGQLQTIAFDMTATADSVIAGTGPAI